MPPDNQAPVGQTYTITQPNMLPNGSGGFVPANTTGGNAPKKGDGWLGDLLSNGGSLLDGLSHVIGSVKGTAPAATNNYYSAPAATAKAIPNEYIFIAAGVLVVGAIAFFIMKK
jgi:hypothetical protein